MNSRNLLITRVLAASLVCCVALQAAAKTKEPTSTSAFDMMDQLDKLDKQDFQEAVDKANDCTRARDFGCAESFLKKAAKLANGNKDKKILLASNQSFASGKQQVENERRQAEERREAENERERLAEERQRQAEERESREQSNREQERANAQYAASVFQGIGRQNDDLTQLAQRNNQRILQQIEQGNQRRQAEADAAAEQQRRSRREQQEASDREASARARQRTESQQLAQAETRDRRAEAERAEQRRKDEQDRQERAQQQEQQRQEAARERADRLAQEKAEKAQEQRAKETYLAAMRQGIRLGAAKCPGGDGKYYVSGTRPRIKGEGCIDVTFEASCPDNRFRTRGTASVFVGMNGCFGDTYPIEPTPPCPVNDVRVQVTNVQYCGN